MDIDGMGEEIIGRLIDEGRLRDVADFYSLTRERARRRWTWAA